VGFKLTLLVISTDCTGSYKSNYHTITTTAAPRSRLKCIHISLYTNVNVGACILINTVLFSEKKKCVMEKYETLKKLGIGGCGAVYLVKDKETKK
jgi:hypothetical protein